MFQSIYLHVNTWHILFCMIFLTTWVKYCKVNIKYGVRNSFDDFLISSVISDDDKQRADQITELMMMIHNHVYIITIAYWYTKKYHKYLFLLLHNPWLLNCFFWVRRQMGYNFQCYPTRRGRSVSRHDDVIKWKHFPRYWLFVRGIHRSPVNSPHKGQWRGTLMFSLICAWINGWVNNRMAGDLRRHRVQYDVTVMGCFLLHFPPRFIFENPYLNTNIHCKRHDNLIEYISSENRNRNVGCCWTKIV